MKIFSTPLCFLLTFLLFAASCEKELENPQEYKVSIDAVGGKVTLADGADSILLSANLNDTDEEMLEVLWSKLEGPGTPVFHQPDSLSTWVTGFEDGTYIFKISVTDNKGSSGADTLSVTVVKHEILTVTLNPANNTDEVHLFGSATIDQTHPDAPEVLAGSGTFEGEPVNIRALIKFDLSHIPENAVIDSAVLTLFTNYTPLNGQNGDANSGTDNSLYISRVAEAWDYTTITWLNQPSIITEGRIAVPHTSARFEDLTVNVKELVDALRTENNYGFHIQLQNEEMYTFRIFCSSKFADESRHPRLDIKYHLE